MLLYLTNSLKSFLFPKLIKLTDDRKFSFDYINDKKRMKKYFIIKNYY
jgi:hypothetical protein